jgi:hypothetical protein
MVADPIGGYLDELDRSLSLPAAERAAIREEIESHLHEERSSLITEGLEPDAAATEAIRRQGDAPALGQALTRARQTRRALLAAAGAGTWAAAGAAVRAWILGVATLVAILLAIGLATAILTRGGAGVGFLIVDPGWYTALGALTLWFAAWAAGRMFVTVAARESHRPGGGIRPWIAVSGGVVVAWLALIWLRGPQNLASVLALGVVPVWFALAAMTGSDRPIPRTRLARRAGLALFVTMALGLPLLALAVSAPITTTLSSVGSGPYASVQDMFRALGFDMAGRLPADIPMVAGSGFSQAGGVITATADGAAALSARWHDLRIEAWRANLTTGSLDRTSPAPFAIAPVHIVGNDGLAGSVRVDATRDVSTFMIVLTGVAPDGQRDFLTSLGGTNTSFNGSALDWLRAP